MVASCHVKDALFAMTMLFSFLEIKKKLKQASNNWWLLKYKNGADKNISRGISWKCGEYKSDDWHYDGKYSCIWNYLLCGYIVVSG